MCHQHDPFSYFSSPTNQFVLRSLSALQMPDPGTRTLPHAVTVKSAMKGELCNSWSLGSGLADMPGGQAPKLVASQLSTLLAPEEPQLVQARCDALPCCVHMQNFLLLFMVLHSVGARGGAACAGSPHDVTCTAASMTRLRKSSVFGTMLLHLIGHST